MLSALEGSGFDGVCVLVTRYYGGTQLGAGGLVRAYGGAASSVLEDAPGDHPLQVAPRGQDDGAAG